MYSIPPNFLNYQNTEPTDQTIKFKPSNSTLKQIYQLPYHQDKTIQQYKQDLSIKTKYEGRVLLDHCKAGELKLSNCTVSLLLIKLKKNTDGQQKLVFSPFVPARCRPNFDMENSSYSKKFQFISNEQMERRRKKEQEQQKIITIKGADDKKIKLKQIKLDKKTDKKANFSQLQKFINEQMPFLQQGKIPNFFQKFMQTSFFEQLFGQIMDQPQQLMEKIHQLSSQFGRKKKQSNPRFKQLSQSQTIVALDMQTLMATPKIRKMIQRGCSQQQIAKALQECEFEVNGKMVKMTRIQNAARIQDVKKQFEQNTPKQSKAQKYKRMIELQDKKSTANQKAINIKQNQTKKQSYNKSITISKQASKQDSEKLQLINIPEFQKALQDLSDLGFKDKQLNTKILLQEDGNLQLTLNRLCLGV